MGWLSLATSALGKATEEPNVDEQYQNSVRLFGRRSLWLHSEVMGDDEEQERQAQIFLVLSGCLSCRE